MAEFIKRYHRISTLYTHFLLTLKLMPKAACLALLLLYSSFAIAQSNVIVIVADDAGFVDFGFQGSTDIPTPNLDALALSGVRFSNAYSASVCSASRAALVTGAYGARIGYEHNIDNSDTSVIGTGPTQGLTNDIVTVFDRMQNTGYTTGAVGKWHLGMHMDNVQNGVLVKAGNQPAQQGVDEFFGVFLGSRTYWVGSQTSVAASMSTQTLNPNGTTNTVNVESQYADEYVTDVFGSASVNFIDRHYQEDDPFFLYTAFTAPHTPLEAKPDDLAAIDAMGNNLTVNRRTYAAMQLAMDRAVGDIVAKLDDPDGNPQTNDSILNETLIMFVNDNGGPRSNASYNGILRGVKGEQWEGGLRVPMLIAGAGIAPSTEGATYDNAVHLVDILPTALAAAGGTYDSEDVIDGVDLLPYLNGDLVDAPHPSLFLRRFSHQQSAVRVGDWKLVHNPSDGFLLFDLATNPSEIASLSQSEEQPALLAQMQQVLTEYEVQMDKPRAGNFADNVNQFDTFRFREGGIIRANWSADEIWLDSDGGTGSHRMIFGDSYANVTLRFRTKSTSDYLSFNDLKRVSGLPYMANKIRFTDNLSSTLVDAHQGTIAGFPILLAQSLDGNLPVLDLVAVDSTPGVFTFNVSLDIELYDDLTIQGDGNQDFVFSGQLREYQTNRNITKTGASTVSLLGGLDISGQFTVDEGTVRIGSTPINSGSLDLNAGRLHLDNSILNSVLDIQALSKLTGQGNIHGITNNRGTISPGLPVDLSQMAPTQPPVVNTDIITAVDFAFIGQNITPLSRTHTVSDSAMVTHGVDVGLGLILTDPNAGTSETDMGNEINIRHWTTGHFLTTALANHEFVYFAVQPAPGLEMLVDSASFNLWREDLESAESFALLTSQDGFMTGSELGTLDAALLANEMVGIENSHQFITNVSGNDWTTDEVEVRLYGWNAISSASTIHINGASMGARFRSLPITPDTYIPLDPTGTITIDGHFWHSEDGMIEIDLQDTDHDSIEVLGDALLEGDLTVFLGDYTPLVGDSFSILTTLGNLAGTFQSAFLPTLNFGLTWDLFYSDSEVVLSVSETGDFDLDGDVDGNDFLSWQRDSGNPVDLNLWQEQFGAVPALNITTVPESSSMFYATFAFFIMLIFSSVCKTVRSF
ncbi:MAG: sulfatase-like hydrolase/transferase [Pirellulales bacterium]